MTKIIACLIIVISFSSCASSTGVLKMGPDTYTVTAGAAPVRGGMAGARQMAYQEASQHCASMKKEIQVTDEAGADVNTNGFPGGQSRLTFKCLEASDPQLANAPEVKPSMQINNQPLELFKAPPPREFVPMQVNRPAQPIRCTSTPTRDISGRVISTETNCR